MDVPEVWKLPFEKHLILDIKTFAWNYKSLIAKTFDDNGESRNSF